MATEPREKMEEIISYLKPLVESYRLLVNRQGKRPGRNYR